MGIYIKDILHSLVLIFDPKGGGGVGGVCKKVGFFLRNIIKCPFTNWLNGRWFLQIVDRDSGNLYPIYPPFPCSDF